MARRRYLSTEISIDKALNRLATEHGDFAALLYTWMIPHALDNTLIEADPEELLYIVMPRRRDVTVEQIEAALTAMDDLDLIIWDRAAEVIQFPPESFYKYQTYIPPAKRTTAKRRRTPKNADNRRNAEERRETPLSYPSPSPSPSPSPTEEIPKEEAAAVACAREGSGGGEDASQDGGDDPLVWDCEAIAGWDLKRKATLAELTRLRRDYPQVNIGLAVSEVAAKADAGGIESKPSLALRAFVRQMAEKQPEQKPRGDPGLIRPIMVEHFLQQLAEGCSLEDLRSSMASDAEYEEVKRRSPCLATA